MLLRSDNDHLVDVNYVEVDNDVDDDVVYCSFYDNDDGNIEYVDYKDSEGGDDHNDDYAAYDVEYNGDDDAGDDYTCHRSWLSIITVITIDIWPNNVYKSHLLTFIEIEQENKLHHYNAETKLHQKHVSHTAIFAF